VEVYQRYLAQYRIEDAMFPYTDRFLQLLFAGLKKRTKIAKELTPKTLRHTHVVRAYKRGEDPERIFDRIGLAPVWHRIREKKPIKCTRGLQDGGYKGVKEVYSQGRECGLLCVITAL